MNDKKIEKQMRQHMNKCYKIMELDLEGMLKKRMLKNFPGLQSLIKPKEKNINFDVKERFFYNEKEILERTFSNDFINKMKNRLLVSFCKYGDLKKTKQDIRFFRDEIKNAKYRIKRYEETAHLEYLIDAANFLMFEYMEMNGDFISKENKEDKII